MPTIQTLFTVKHSDEIVELVRSGVVYTDPYYFMDKGGDTLAVVSACQYDKHLTFYVTKSKFTKDLVAAIKAEYIVVRTDKDFDPILGHQQCLSVKYKTARSRNGQVAVPTPAPYSR